MRRWVTRAPARTVPAAPSQLDNAEQAGNNANPGVETHTMTFESGDHARRRGWKTPAFPPTTPMRAIGR